MNETIGIEEAARLLGISPSTLRRRIEAGEVKPLPSAPLLKRPAKLLFSRTEIERANAPRPE